ncbi:MAG: Crp/Fnr family transcriptional regulator [Bryobacteraceae bacterium]|jgi:CRP-like cAMP-binding protein
MPLPQEDPLTYLAHKPADAVPKGGVIYPPGMPVERLYLVVTGCVKIGTIAPGGKQVVSRIVPAEGLFGEACLLGAPSQHESATALDSVTLMNWTRAEIERQIEREPRFGVALSQYVLRLGCELADRIETMAMLKTPERVVAALLQLGTSLGRARPDGVLRMPGLTHHTVSEYVGTSREIVTYQMTRLRSHGLIRYSRQFIDIDVKGLEAALRGGVGNQLSAIGRQPSAKPV